MVDSRIGKVEGWDVLENNVIHHIEKYQNKIYFLLKKMGSMSKKMDLCLPENPLNETLKQLISMLPIS
jgi:hypothetical protein